jgi:hypothetical protein
MKWSRLGPFENFSISGPFENSQDLNTRIIAIRKANAVAISFLDQFVGTILRHLITGPLFKPLLKY